MIRRRANKQISGLWMNDEEPREQEKENKAMP